MNVSRVLLALLTLSASSFAVARADTFNFSFGTTANDFYGSGTFTGNLVSPGEYQITGVTGSSVTNGTHANSSIEATGTFEGNDNLLFVSSSGVGTLDVDGISYLLANGAQINLKTTTTGDAEILERTNSNIVNEAATFTITAATPEPGSFVLLGTGLLGVIGATRRRLSA